MNNAAQAIRLQRTAALIALGACAVLGIVAALFPMGILAAIAFLLLAAGCVYVFSSRSSIIVLLPAVCSFALMSRFDEGYAISISESLRIPVVYWLTALCLGLLVAIIVRQKPREAASSRLAATLWLGIGAFAVAGLVSIFFNYAFDPYIPERSIVGELLALAGIVVPMGFVATIPALNLSRRQAGTCITALIGLGAATAFLLGAFGLFPGVMTRYLGWVSVGFGTLDLARGRTPLGHPNTVAAVLQMFMVAAVVLGVRRERTVARVFYLGSAAFIFVGILFSLSRAAVAVAVFMLVVALMYLFFTRRSSRMIAMAAVGAFLLVLCGSVGFLIATYDFSRLWSRAFHEEASVEGRMASMKTGLKVWEDHALFGSAPGALYPRLEIFPSWMAAGRTTVSEIIYYRGNESAPHPHNLYILGLAEFGLVGGAAFVAFLGLVAAAVARLVFNPAVRAADREMLVAGGLAFVAVLCSAMGEALFLVNIRHGIVLWILIGLVLRYGLASLQEKETETLPAT